MASYYFLLSLTGLLSLFALRSLFRKISSSVRHPPSPPSLPIIGHLHLLAPIPHQSLHKLANRHGPLIRVLLGSVPCVVVSSADMAREFLKTHEASFSDRPQLAIVDRITYGSQDFSFAPYGPYWKFMKKLCMTELLSGPRIDSLLPARREELRRLVALILGKAERKESVDVGNELVKMAMNVTTRMMMNTTCSDSRGEADEMVKVVREMAELTGKFNLSDYIWFCKNLDLQGFRKRVDKVHHRFDSLVERIIKEHEEDRKGEGEAKQGTAKDLLHVLLDISQDPDAEMKLTRENIKAFILDIFAAGTDTAALTTQWALAELINHPNIMRRATQEIDSVVGTSRLVEESDISGLPYLQAIVKETLRLHPTGPMIVRESSESCNIRGYDIPAKTRLLINVWAIMRDPSYWENPLEFLPERFLVEEGSGRNQMDVRGQHFELIPFGSGRRSCPGTTLALHMVQTSVATLIQCFDWGLVGGKDTVDMTEGAGLTLPMAHPLVCLPVERLEPFPAL